MRDLSTALLSFFFALMLPGCGYTLGAQTRENVRRVAVPVFENRTLRRGFERDLTRAVQREIKETLPYLLSLENDADLTLKGSILSINESVLVEGRDDEVLEGLIQITVQVQLFDALDKPVLITRQASDNQGIYQMIITDQAEFVLSRGETRDSATREAIREMAERIVQILAGPPSIPAGP